jgi:hypothetical protein
MKGRKKQTNIQVRNEEKTKNWKGEKYYER